MLATTLSMDPRYDPMLTEPGDWADDLNLEALPPSSAEPAPIQDQPPSFGETSPDPPIFGFQALPETDVTPVPQRHQLADLITPKEMRLRPRRRRRARFTTPQRRILKTWFQENIQNPYPTQDEKIQLVKHTRLSTKQVEVWFSNARKRQQNVNPSGITFSQSASGHSQTPMERYLSSSEEDEAASLQDIAHASIDWNEPSSFTIFEDWPESTDTVLSQDQSPDGHSKQLTSRALQSESSTSSVVSGTSLGPRQGRRRHGIHSTYRDSTLKWSSHKRGVAHTVKFTKRRHDCSYCTHSFKTAYDCRRHENSSHLWTKRWVCKLHEMDIKSIATYQLHKILPSAPTPLTTRQAPALPSLYLGRDPAVPRIEKNSESSWSMNQDVAHDVCLKPGQEHCFCESPLCSNLSFTSDVTLLLHQEMMHPELALDNRRLLCQYPHCPRAQAGEHFLRAWDLYDHMKRVHNHIIDGPEFQNQLLGPKTEKPFRERETRVLRFMDLVTHPVTCNFPIDMQANWLRCANKTEEKRSFLRKDNLVQHLRNVHGLDTDTIHKLPLYEWENDQSVREVTQHALPEAGNPSNTGENNQIADPADLQWTSLNDLSLCSAMDNHITTGLDTDTGASLADCFDSPMTDDPLALLSSAGITAAVENHPGLIRCTRIINEFTGEACDSIFSRVADFKLHQFVNHHD